MVKASERRGFGRVRRLPSGRWQAFYADPDGRTQLSRNGIASPVRYTAPVTFDSRVDAEAWLTDERRLISSGDWRPPAERTFEKRQRVTFGEYAGAWMVSRRVKGKPLADRTRVHYQDLLNRFILPTFKDLPLDAIGTTQVDLWYQTTAVGTPTTQAHAYSLLRAILTTAVDRRVIDYNPARVRGGGSPPTEHRKVDIPTPEELATMIAAMPERLRLMVELAAFRGLRFGELAELRRGDVDTKRGVLRVRRAVVRAGGQVIKKDPKSGAGVRDVTLPPVLLAQVREHLLKHTEPGKDGLLFPASNGGTLATSTLYKHWYKARETAERPDLHFHDLRHVAGTTASVSGATAAEVMRLLGHSTPKAAMRYQQATDAREREIAEAMYVRLTPAVDGADAP